MDVAATLQACRVTPEGFAQVLFGYRNFGQGILKGAPHYSQCGAGFRETSGE